MFEQLPKNNPYTNNTCKHKQGNTCINKYYCKNDNQKFQHKQHSKLIAFIPIQHKKNIHFHQVKTTKHSDMLCVTTKLHFTQSAVTSVIARSNSSIHSHNVMAQRRHALFFKIILSVSSAGAT